MKSLVVAVIALSLLLSLSLPARAAGPLFITEVVPDNARTLADEDGEYPDWIEIHNPTGSAINLGGWHLTDDPLAPAKWTFPSVNLASGGYLVVFASGKNRTTDPAHLHTSFQLDAGGEHIALILPDGSTVSSELTFPAVKQDVSFGLAQSLVTAFPLSSSAPQVLVPTSAAGLPSAWNRPEFVPGAEWLTGQAPPAVGFDTNQIAGLPANVATSGTAVQSTTQSSFTPNLAINNNLNDFSHTLGTDPAPFWQVTLTNQMAIFSVVINNRTSCCGSRLRDITVDILITNETGTVTNFSSALLNPENAGFTYPNGPTNLTLDLVALTGGPVSGRIVRVSRTPDPDLSGSAGQGNVDEANVLSLGEVVVNAAAAAGLRPYFTTDLRTPMWKVNASAFLRLPFQVSSVPDQLSLRVRYDDGFIAYLNGVEVARRNAPADPGWNGAATADRNLLNASTAETINLTSALSSLVTGANLLAVQLLNASADNADALWQGDLTATRVVQTPNVYFDVATPGAANTAGWYLDEVKDTQFSVDRGFFEAPFTLAITSETPGASIYYSLNGDEPAPGKGLLYTGPLNITNTTVVRARAFKDGWKPTDVDSGTYLFLADVIRQVPSWEQNRIPPQYFPTNWGPNAVDYGMDPQIVNNYTLAQWKEALTQIPSMSIVTEMRNLFDPATGIYANASGHGEVWERPTSLELIDPSKAVPGQFQENCGLRIRGGASRDVSFKKHSFRVFFRREYGAGKLNYPLFEKEGAEEFETFDLRTSQNYSWPRSGDNPLFETMVREVWCRKTLGDMGQPYRRSRYYHLYLNGQYWGLYETDERPEASYGQTYLGGSKTNFDVVKCGNRGVNPNFATEATDGNLVAWSNLWVMTQTMRTNAVNSNYFRILGSNPDGTRNPALPVMLDADNLIDYMLEIFYSGDGDATLSSFLGNNQPNNWYGMRDRTNPDAGFRFFNNDCEHTLGSPNSQVDRTGPFPGSNEGNFTYSNPQWMHEALMRNLEYRLRFADHVQKHFFNGGALTLDACTNRFIAKMVQITKAIRAYSARWGDAATPTAPFGETNWTNAIQFVMNWFPPRANIVLNQLLADNLYSSVNAPVFSSYGGFVPPDAQLTLTQTNAAGTIYFTTDGTDPRRVAGDLAPGALPYTGPVPIGGNAIVLARTRVGTNWSAVVRANFTTSSYFKDLAITEIMYNPPGTTNVAGDEFEFVELKNTGSTEINLSGVFFSSGITFTFTNDTRLSPGAFFVLVRNPAQFQARYPGAPINGLYSGRLDNGGETLRLAHVIGGSLGGLTYDDDAPWPLAADGFGYSIVPASLSTNLNSDNPTHWRASSAAGGSPGADDPAPTIPAIVINEVLTHTLTGQDFIELHNPTATPANVGGWFLTDDKGVPQKFQIPDGTTIPAQGYWVFTEADFNPTPGLGTSFTLNADHDDVYLFSGRAPGELTGYSHGFAFDAAPDGVSFGRHLLSTGEEQFPLQNGATPGQPNAGPRLGPVVMSELHYNPRPGDDAFIEVRNTGAEAVPMFESAPTNTWRLNGVDFRFPVGFTLPAGGYAVVSSSEPASFRARYGVPASVPVFGPYGGGLQDSGERLELQRPDFRGTNGWTFVTMDEVRYNDRAPWPTAADGVGPSLQRQPVLAFGNEPLNWRAASPTPGRDFVVGVEPTITQNPSPVTAVATREATFAVTAGGPGPLSYQWRFNGSSVAGATNSILTLTALQLAQSGSYSVVVYNDAGAVESAPATLTVLAPARILLQPADILVRIRPDPQSAPATNVTFLVAAASTSPITYQWRFNGVPLAGAVNPTLTITNVQLANEGAYSVDITDAAGTIFSGEAKLYPLISPIITQNPVAQTVVPGSVVTLSVQVTGNPKPFSYEWRRASFPLITNVSSATQDFFTFVVPNAAPATVQYRVVVRNLANPAPGAAGPLVNVVVLPDTDGDQIADAWETSYGLNPASAADANGDLDGDGLSNRQEFEAGTSPIDPTSFLRVELVRETTLARVSFGAVSNLTYSLQYSDQPGGSWLRLADVVARPTNRVETITDPTSQPTRFYRAVTPQQR